MNLFITDLYQKLDVELETIELNEPVSLKKTEKSIVIVNNALIRLKKFTSNYKFPTESEEIHFFKKTKPELLSKLLFFIQLLDLESRKPKANWDIQENYLKTELDKIIVLTNKNLQFYQYYRLDLNVFDDKYFVRGITNVYYTLENILPCIDLEFSTSHDHLIAQIMTNDLLVVFLNSEIEKLINTKNNPHVDYMGNNSQQKLVWTESKSSLIELIYALCATNCLNDGRCDIRDLSARFEQIFNVRLPDAYRTYQDIKTRKSPIQFIDSLKTSLQKKFDEDFQ